TQLRSGHHWDSSSPHRNVDRLRSGDHWDSSSLCHHWDSSSPHRNVDLPRTQLRSRASLGPHRNVNLPRTQQKYGHHWDSSSPHRNVIDRGLNVDRPRTRRRSTEDSTEVLVIIGTCRVPTETSIYRGLNRGLGHHWDS
ncbi:24252_t:CDS:2, partial [Gigaspora rosea]